MELRLSGADATVKGSDVGGRDPGSNKDQRSIESSQVLTDNHCSL